MSRWLWVVLLTGITLATALAGDLVKKSTSGICHDWQSSYYQRTKNFQPFNDLSSCLQSGGRLPQGHPGLQLGRSPDTRSQQAQTTHRVAVQERRAVDSSPSDYERAQFGQWIDEDHDCLNTRHELLAKLSTSTIETGSSRCLVRRGRWNDPYTGKIFYESRQMDIDHLVPLKWAWDHGANSWPREKRVAFANDEANLFAVEASINRQKGTLGPLQWLPPSVAFRCQYILRFSRIVKKYGLLYTPRESSNMDTLRTGVCG